MSHLKFYFCVGAAFGSPQVTNIKTVARTAKGGPYNVKFKVIQRTTFLYYLTTESLFHIIKHIYLQEVKGIDERNDHINLTF